MKSKFIYLNNSYLLNYPSFYTILEKCTIIGDPKKVSAEKSIVDDFPGSILLKLNDGNI